MALKEAAAKTLFIPFTAQAEVPELRLVLGCVLLILFLLVGWIWASPG